MRELAIAEAKIEEDLKRIKEEKTKYKERQNKTFDDFKVNDGPSN